jgi:prepilin-type N-terminal cleavage/methylation domain-containing protein
MFFPKKNYIKAYPTESYRRGFTLVELLVTISIFVILTGVVLFSQSKFDSTILLTNLAYDTALTIRQAQTYGVNVKESFNPFVVGGGSAFNSYGVYFDNCALTNPGCGETNKSFILFTDLGNYIWTLFADDPLGCNQAAGCVNRYSIKRGNYISRLCVSDVSNEACPDIEANKVNSLGDPAIGLRELFIEFKRPNPEALIYANRDSNHAFAIATIFLSSPGGGTRQVRVQKNGLIEVRAN